MGDALPPPPPPSGPGADAPPPPPGVPERPSRARIWVALTLAVAAVTALVAILVVAFAPSASDGSEGSDGGGVLFRDDFSGEGAPSRFLEAADAGGSMGASGGRYRMTVADGGELQSIAPLDGPQESVRVQVDATMLNGTGGVSVLCVSEVPGTPSAITSSGDRGVYYDFYVTPVHDGYAIFSSRQREALQIGEDDAGTLRDGANRVVVACDGRPGEGATLTLSVNGREVLRHADPAGSGAFRAVGFALFSEEGPAEAEFDDVVVSTG